MCCAGWGPRPLAGCVIWESQPVVFLSFPAHGVVLLLHLSHGVVGPYLETMRGALNIVGTEEVAAVISAKQLSFFPGVQRDCSE